MKKAINMLAVLAAVALITVMSVSAYTWNVDKSVVVTGDWLWSGGAWTLPTIAPTTATYGFEARGDGMNVDYAEGETLGQAWKYSLNNELSTDGSGAVHAFANIDTLNVPVVTPATEFTKYAFGTMNDGAFGHSEVVISGQGFANINHMASFTGGFTSKNFVCINNCVN